MKRKSLRTLVCALLASLALTTFAFADSGPKPLLIVLCFKRLLPSLASQLPSASRSR